MKKLVGLILSLGLLLSLAAPAAAANETLTKTITYRAIKIILDGEETVPCNEQGNTVAPFIMDGSTYLPLRAVAQALGLGVRWVPETNTVELAAGGEPISGSGESSTLKSTGKCTLTYRDIKVSLDGAALSLAAEPFIMDGSTYLPLRAIGEALGLEVGWDAAASTVSLQSFSEERSVEILALDREGEMLLSTSETVTRHYRDRTEVSVLSGSGAKSDYVLYYTKDGKPLSAACRSGNGESLYTESWTYDEEGLLRRYVYDDAAGSEGDSCTLYEYKGAVLTRSKRYDGDTVPRVHSTDTSYTYDEKGNIIRLYHHLPMGSWEEVLFEYDADGQLLSERSVFYDIIGSGFSKSGTDYFYADGRLVRSEGTGGYVTEYFYGANGELEKTLEQRPDGNFVITKYF